MSVLTDIKDYLVTAGLGTFGTDLFIGRLPESPNNATALYEIGGDAPQFTHDSTVPYLEMPNVQVVVRNITYANGRQGIERIYRAMSDIANQTISGTRYYRSIPLQNPFYLRRDANERAEFVCNFQINKAQGHL